ncbi:acyl-CoA dehydrogenase-like protein [Cytobacillus horneckiae]|uniref:Acyl-CoA dehydrogenase n=1 Tax=Cytobacillus horneckiae TaxID=549687 RepID=A0A2N0Z9E4_9BACI|nr:acyl-CoA dehydrogenase family protein [Cytobacillus horneckiae]MBN6886571.1 acyl-CoA dehydrogenase family protein [Cytobacillus horneckiae]MCM3177960.1 acyl-CoA dehydrogenase family protein [Cytobacillus horneckiae]MEC1159210.1 acyl-CoA dehydrogenase family protein [Cytobacillus horneckiae]MED2935897.1 acyl-CoA dehydrogenase family protein [Cytobacillus horneckiae]PKG26110.1 acyl-CoA dehydrogenase [Cytobacillus horneckiae]
MIKLELPVVKFTAEQTEFRNTVREFLIEEKKRGAFESRCDSWLSGESVDFSRKLGQKGWIGMTWPKKYGGRERSALERYILTEELLTAGAPVAAHWFADRQTGPLFLKFGTEEQKNFFLPMITKGECFFSIGLSEPNAGSDLAAIKTKAERTDGGWLLNGSKIWTSGAHLSHYMIVLCRTSPFDPNNRHAGMSQLVVNMKAEGLTVRPIQFLTGQHHFNEVFFENVFVPDNRLIGIEGNGWKQGMAELAYERSGPERILSTYPLLDELIKILRENDDEEGMREAVSLLPELWTLRNMSMGVAKYLEEGHDVNMAAALVKELGTKFETSIAEKARLLLSQLPSIESAELINRFMAQSILHGPGFTLRGGTTEILRGIVAKGVVSQ